MPPRGFALLILLIAVALAVGLSVMATRWYSLPNAALPAESPGGTQVPGALPVETPGTVTAPTPPALGGLPGLGGEQRCGNYTIDGVSMERCAKCGNKICESFETCTPSAVDRTEGLATADCGPLYCPKDCPKP